MKSLISAVLIIVCLLPVSCAKKAGKVRKLDLSDVVNPDPEAVYTKTKEYGDLFEGDIDESMDGKDRNANSYEQLRWPDAKVPYVFDYSVGYELRQKIEAAMSDFHQFTCIRWTPRYNEQNSIRFLTTGSGCNSKLGMKGGEQKLNLEAPGCHLKGTIIHEMLHALGFSHEQNRGDRDNYVTIHLNNIHPYYQGQFSKLGSWYENNQGFGYDFSSVMHYGPDGFSINNKPTITTNDPWYQDKIGQRAGFSKQDIQEVNKLYKCSGY